MGEEAQAAAGVLPGLLKNSDGAPLVRADPIVYPRRVDPIALPCKTRRCQ